MKRISNPDQYNTAPQRQQFTKKSKNGKKTDNKKCHKTGWTDRTL